MTCDTASPHRSTYRADTTSYDAVKGQRLWYSLRHATAARPDGVMNGLLTSPETDEVEEGRETWAGRRYVMG
jgi:hypothetical protein